MPRPKKQPLSFVEKMRKVAAARLSGNQPIPPPDAATTPDPDDALCDLGTRVRHLLGITSNYQQREQGNMLFFVMYDIESNKVRRLVSKYLISKGCFRMQRSIFLGDTSSEIYNQIRSDLTEVQAAYENEDSIIVLPISTDYLRTMKIIGQKLNLDIVTQSTTTLFC